MGGENGLLEGRDQRISFLGLPFDPIGKRQILEHLHSTGAVAKSRYIVTPNVDHIVRVSQKPAFRILYEDAWLSLCDSKPVHILAKLHSKKISHIAGSDLTEFMFKEIIRPGDLISIVAAYDHVAEGLSLRFPDVRFRAHVPPFGVLDKPEALQATIDFLAAEPARFVFIAIGSPQSEIIAREFSCLNGANGVVLCIGASLEFILGTQRRAPVWMRGLALEWLFRLVSEPQRLWRRYAFSVWPFAKIYWKEIRSISRPDR